MSARNERPVTALNTGAVAANENREQDTESLWTVAEVAKYLKVSKSWIYQATARGAFPCIRIGALLRFDPGEVKAWARGERGGKVVLHLAASGT